MAASPRNLLSFRLPSTKRLISWAEFGSPNGRPIIYLHGTPSSRLECAEFHHALHDRNIRLIAPDRPGFGRSEVHTGRTIGGYASDVRALAKQLNLSEYAVMGQSGGGPYALACARHPEEGLRAVAVLGGLSPFESGLEGAHWATSCSLRMSKWTPSLLGFFLRLPIPSRKGNFTGPLEEWTVDPSMLAEAEKTQQAFINTMKGREKDIMSKPGVLHYLTTTFVEATIQGVDAHLYESKLFAQEWDFKLQDITFASEGKRPLVMWYGTDDINTTVHMGKWIAERVTGSQLREVDGETHNTLAVKFVDYCDEILQMTKV
ncbi:hypothetical protein CEP51_003111 [Fusarium floridanum]|uniref:AB hydrolase-1 domain-containing protein n=1 Tax=Fusarium floridanum TaxID=1325733 RepID=A0A428S7R5_9HYPO|nr:hypothetical protein CEP51_003111 [Fusarium floridanum]